MHMSLLQGNPALIDQLGRPLQELRLSVTDRCNFRCRYCMPRERFQGHRFLPQSHLLTFAELTRVVGILYSLGVRRVRLTGGEPLLRQGLPQLIRSLAALAPDLELVLTTNGVLLPALAGPLRQAGLSEVTVSLDASEAEVFRHMTDSSSSVEAVWSGIAAALRAGVPVVKVNCVVQRGVNEGQVLPLAERLRGTGVVLRFIEYMDVGETNGWSPQQVVSADEILGMLAARWPLQEVPRARHAAPAQRYRYVDGAGEVGVIASVTKPFCGTCVRARLAADGNFHTCLFGPPVLDLALALRSGATDAELRSSIVAGWQGRNDRYSELRGLVQLGRRRPEMSYLGG